MEKLRVEIKDCGTKRYYKWDTDELHNPYGPAVEYADGDKVWYLNGKRHREDGPAVEDADGDKSWWINGKRHREDGPAIEYADGDKEWWVNGVELTEKEFHNRHSCTSKIVEIDGKRYKLEEV